VTQQLLTICARRSRPAAIIEGGQVVLVRCRVTEGSLPWQFPAWQVEVRETAAVRGAGEVVAVMVAETQILGERVHPAIGRTMIYVACDVVDATPGWCTTRSLGGCLVRAGQLAGDVAWLLRAGPAVT
jgi:hypothetical protein